MDSTSLRCATALLFVVSALAGCTGTRLAPVDVQSARDPATTDPAPFDVDHPPGISEVTFSVGDAAINGIVYRAQGVGPHPTVVLLHGFPGNERNLDLAQAIRRGGWNVVFFHYRGAWGSGGEFSFAHVLEDVAAVVETIGQPAFAQAHRIDPRRLALVGHSMGGFAALVAGSEIAEVSCVVSMAGANLGLLARSLGQAADRADAFAATLDGWSGPIRSPGGRNLIHELEVNAERFDTTNHARALARKDLLLIAGERDVVTPATLHHGPLVEALEAAGAKSLQTMLFENGDHAFSGQRIALARSVTGWLESDCRRFESPMQRSR